jgi:hypothetical protein
MNGNGKYAKAMAAADVSDVILMGASLGEYSVGKEIADKDGVIRLLNIIRSCAICSIAVFKTTIH